MAKRKDCILFATADWDTPYWTNKQHTAKQLAEKGYHVLYIESVGLRAPNLTSGRDISRIWKRLQRGLATPRQVHNNIWVLSPLLFPFKHHWPLVRLVNQGILRWAINRFVKKYAFVMPMVWTYHPFILESLPTQPIGSIIYHCVDDLSAVPGVDAEAFNHEEQRLLIRSNAVFTTSPVLRDKCAAYNSNIHDFPNVVDADHFGRALQRGHHPIDMSQIPKPRIGYIGVLSDFKVDFALILAIATRKPEWQWIFIGDEREGQHSPLVQKLYDLPNIHFLGYRQYNLLPDYLEGFNVAVLPTLINDYTQAMFPMKYFEYLAAGVPVVSTPLDFTRHHNAGLKVGSDVDSFIQAIEYQLDRGKLTPDEATLYVGENTWSTRLGKMLECVADCKQ
jgi:glycosyltransferase involved in cell wall biosynthesis